MKRKKQKNTSKYWEEEGWKEIKTLKKERKVKKGLRKNQRENSRKEKWKALNKKSGKIKKK